MSSRVTVWIHVSTWTRQRQAHLRLVLAIGRYAVHLNVVGARRAGGTGLAASVGVSVVACLTGALAIAGGSRRRGLKLAGACLANPV